MLQAAGVGVGDEVIVPAYGDAEAAEAVVRAGAAPVFADIDPDTYCIDPTSVAEQVGERTAAVVAVHRFGQRADVVRLRELGRRRGLLVLEQGESMKPHGDVAQRRAHAAYLSGRLSGVRTPVGHEQHTYQQYVVRVPGNGRPDRDAFARVLRGKGVGCQVPVKTPVHRLPEFRCDAVLPETERAADETLALPLDAGMSRRQLQRVVSACNALGGLLQPAF
ncbi:DegT/DnrJ/EryC1/StrS family aminotransferase [Streptomyces sp. NPDC050085]|uniref:DegT/DnrJ/EryC1/StrS family aminotransferase n=1 Tax=Streptomyces sp. NPDC050085 TaxID=3365600 RepID=UPI00379C1490